MRITVLGCGAMGSIYAGLLASSGHDVSAVDTNEVHVHAINEHGLRVSGASGDRRVQISAFTELPEQPIDLLVIAVKGAHVESAATMVKPLIDESTVLLTIQNGLGSADLVAQILGHDRLIVGVAQGFGASLSAPGHAHHNDMKAIRMGSYAELDKDVVTDIASIWKAAGFDAEAVDDIVSMQWEKLICNVAYSALSALTGMTIGEVMDDPEIGPVSQNAAMEAWTIAKARGINIMVDDPIQYVRDFAIRMPNAKPSVLIDIEMGRRSEIGMINGAIPREATKAGTIAPINETLTSLVLAREYQST
ncbi:MAG: 2-dehydropantoate 2-reductase [Gammaproteobacteria bacterium]|jgi:2-dehydropantoate 2-reductase|nr:2-dehydropantoate 2-reductase [Gammaproteobacteria bacterium]